MITSSNEWAWPKSKFQDLMRWIWLNCSIHEAFKMCSTDCMANLPGKILQRKLNQVALCWRILLQAFGVNLEDLIWVFDPNWYQDNDFSETCYHNPRCIKLNIARAFNVRFLDDETLRKSAKETRLKKAQYWQFLKQNVTSFLTDLGFTLEQMLRTVLSFSGV